MPLQQTASGIQIESLQEVVVGFEDDHRDPTVGFGAGASVRPNTAFGQWIGIMSERIALLQQQLQQIQSQFDPNEATGVELDVLCELTATTRKDEDQSVSTSGRIVGLDTTVIPNLSQVRNVGTSDVWEIIGGPYVIPVSGIINCTMRAIDSGAIEFLSATVWEIIDSVVGWTGFITIADIDPEDIGQDVESNEELRQRREDELFAGGNDLSGIKAQVSKVVDEVAIYENKSCVAANADGIPPGAIEVVVEGGDDQEILDAIYERKPPGTETFGQTVNGTVIDTEGNPIPIGFTRVADVDIWFELIVGVGNAEVALPDNVSTLLVDAILEFGNANSAIGQDALPETFATVIWEILKDPLTGKYSAETLDLEVGLTASTANAPIAIDIRSRADYDSARILVAIP